MPLLTGSHQERVSCWPCGGAGTLSKSRCRYCGRTGEVPTYDGTGRRVPCPWCAGVDDDHPRTCERCDGHGWTRELTEAGRAAWRALGLNTRVYGPLARVHITVAAAAAMPDEKLLDARNFGFGALRALRAVLPYQPVPWVPDLADAPWTVIA